MERRYSKSRTLDSFQLVLNRIYRSDILRQYRIKVYKIVSMTLLLLLLVTGALQSTKAELAGIVRDPSGLPVPEAEVRIANAGTDAESKTGTGADGSYRFLGCVTTLSPFSMSSSTRHETMRQMLWSIRYTEPRTPFRLRLRLGGSGSDPRSKKYTVE